MGGLYSGALAHAAAREDGEGDQLAAFVMGDDADVVGVKIDGVVARESKAYLELSRQIRCTIKRFRLAGFRFFGAGSTFSINPDLVISSGLGL